MMHGGQQCARRAATVSLRERLVSLVYSPHGKGAVFRLCCCFQLLKDRFCTAGAATSGCVPVILAVVGADIAIAIHACVELRGY